MNHSAAFQLTDRAPLGGEPENGRSEEAEASRSGQLGGRQCHGFRAACSGSMARFRQQMLLRCKPNVQRDFEVVNRLAHQTGFEPTTCWFTTDPNWRRVQFLRFPVFWYREYPFTVNRTPFCGRRRAIHRIKSEAAVCHNTGPNLRCGGDTGNCIRIIKRS